MLKSPAALELGQPNVAHPHINWNESLLIVVINCVSVCVCVCIHMYIYTYICGFLADWTHYCGLLS